MDIGIDFDNSVQWESNAKLIARKYFDSDNIRTKELPDIGAIYIWEPIRGGKAIIIDNQGNKLAATSSVSLNQHIKEFKARYR